MTSSEENTTQELRTWESGDFTVSKTVLEEGQIELDPFAPRFGATCTAVLDPNWTLDGDLDEAELTSNPALSRLLQGAKTTEPTLINLRIGYSDTDVDRTLDDAVKSMFLNERSDCTLRIKLNSKKNNLKLKNDEIWLRLTFVLTLKSVENSEQVFKWPASLKVEVANEFKNSGVELFGQKRYYDAFLAFRQSLTLISFALEETHKATDANLIDRVEAEDLKLKCSTNLVGCHLQLANFSHVVSLSSDILSLEASSKNVKLLYRRGVANLELKNYELAIHDLKEALDLDPDNKAISNHLNQARIKNKESNQKLSQGLKKMFS